VCKEKRKKQKIFFIKQKACGLFWIIASVVSYLIDKDATLALIAIPFGVYLVFTRKMVMDFSTVYCTKKVHKKKSSTVLVPLKIVQVQPTFIDSRMKEYLKRIDRILENS